MKGLSLKHRGRNHVKAVTVLYSISSFGCNTVMLRPSLYKRKGVMRTAFGRVIPHAGPGERWEQLHERLQHEAARCLRPRPLVRQAASDLVDQKSW